MLRHAERQGLVARNVAAIVPTPAGPRGEGRSLTVEQARALLKAAEGHPLEAAFMVALTCGLRPGELLGCGGNGADLDQGLLRVSRAVRRVGGVVQPGPTKTSGSRRQLRLPDSTVEGLRRHQVRQVVQVDLMGSTGRASGSSSRRRSAPPRSATERTSSHCWLTTSTRTSPPTSLRRGMP